MKVIPQERVYTCTVEQSGHVHIPQSLDEIVEGVQTVSWERFLELVMCQCQGYRNTSSQWHRLFLEQGWSKLATIAFHT